MSRGMLLRRSVWRVLLRALCTLGVWGGLCGALTAAGVVQSHDGQLFVGCQGEARVALRCPVLRFAETVKRNFEEAFIPLGSTTSPLSIVLGSQTNEVSTLVRDRLTLEDGSFSQLIIRVPNPDTVDLELLRCAIVEALLRERARALAGSYASLVWPAWFIRGAVDASKGNDFLAEAYETALAALDAGALPPPERFFSPQAPDPEPAIAAAFARWVLTLGAQAAVPDAQAPSAEAARQIASAKLRNIHRFERLLTAPFTPEAFLPPEAESAWHAWLRERGATVMLPGTITRSQFNRWRSRLRFPESVEEARALADRLPREAVGKPQLFCDLTELYLRAASAALLGDEARARTLWAQAEEACAIFAGHLARTKLLQQDPRPSQPQGSRFHE